MMRSGLEGVGAKGGAMSQVWQLLYRSEQAYEMDSDDMVKLLLDARAFNRENSVTGMLLHHEGQFMQLLEGDQHQVQSLYRRISEDARHRNVTLEVNAPAKDRMFPEWHMGYAAAPEIDGLPALAGAESERTAMDTLRILAREHMSAMRLMQFLRGDH
jgi:Sensors of blue-light using FAD